MRNNEKTKEDLRIVAENCSQFSTIASMTASLGHNTRSCEICKKWDGKRCSIGLYDVIAAENNLR